MRKLVGAALALALLAAPGIAYALEQAGIIDKVDLPALTFTLKNGTEFAVGKNVRLDDLKPGTEVIVTYEEKDGKMVATEVKPSS